MVVGRLLCELELHHEHRPDPPAFFHLCNDAKITKVISGTTTAVLLVGIFFSKLVDRPQ